MADSGDAEMKTVNSNNININNYRKLVQNYLNLHVYDAALFWADKVVALTSGNPRDIYWLAQCMFSLKQYHRAAHLLRSRNLDKKYVLCNYLTVRCLLEANELNQALNVLNSLDLDVLLQNTSSTQNSIGVDNAMFDDTPKHQVQSSVFLLKGKVLEAMDNRGIAADCYKQALQCDVYCYEAFDALIKHHMLSAAEEHSLLNSLPISQQCKTEEAQMLYLLYKSKLKKYHVVTEANPNSNLAPSLIETSTPGVSSHEGDKMKKEIESEHMVIDVPESFSSLQESLDLAVCKAERLYYNCDYVKCMKLTDNILKQDPYHTSCFPIHISCLVELKRSNKLFTLAHNLVDLYPNLAISWFAVGCYYYVIGKRDAARQYLAKATSLDRLFGPAWLAYGHSFATENEHDQAMATYFKASQLMKGCHLPLLYIGLECGLTNNVRLAEKFFQQAQAIAPDDPFVMHEMGVIAFVYLDFKTAEKHFKDALNRVRAGKDYNIILDRWEPLLNNLGHTCRKLKKYDEALYYHHQALSLVPQSASTYSAIGYVNALMGHTEQAVEWFHKALGLRRDDTFSTTMLNYVIEQLSVEQPPYPDAPDHIPDFHVAPTTAEETTTQDSEDSSSRQNNMSTNISDMSIEVDMSDVSGAIKE